MIEAIKQFARKIKTEIKVYRLLIQHPETPKLAKCLLWCAVGYLLLPFDLIPDFIPVLGQLDEMVIVPLLVYAALRITPDTLVTACRVQATQTS